jgi:hypothetical protein
MQHFLSFLFNKHIKFAGIVSSALQNTFHRSDIVFRFQIFCYFHIYIKPTHSPVLCVMYAVPEYTVDTAHHHFVQGTPQHGRLNGNQMEVQ